MKKATEANRYEQSAVLESAESGNVEAQLRLGKMLCGLADRVDDGGLCPWDGYLVQYWDGTSCGMEWLKKASASGNIEAEEILRGIKSGKIHLITEAEYWHNKAMECIYGNGVEKKLERGEELLIALADAGCTLSQRELAKLALGHVDHAYECCYSHNPKELLEKASQRGDGEAQHRLAILEYVGEDDANWGDYPIDSPEFAAGLKWIEGDAEAGNPKSQFEYGEILIWAGDIHKTMARGLEFLSRSAENGYALAAFELGMLYSDTDTDWDGIFCANKAEAIKWFEKAVELGGEYAVKFLETARNS